MKTLTKFFLILLAIFCLNGFGKNLFAQEKKVETVKIKTSAVCPQCKDRIEGGLAFEKGVKDISLDLETKIVTIKYNTKSVTPDDLRRKISNLGYDADSIPANKKAYEKLPACCKKDAAKH
ncbi:MAG: heavy-metal-associated domain-containing protein [Bacteroidales bacterium]|nr:heavy-metal-associated domain-containing protein [Bacteroidales bacterium]